MLGKIGIEKLKVMSVIGVHAHERNDKQILLIDLKVETDLSACAASDSFSDTLDYVALKETCEEVASTHSFCLLESFAAAVVKALQVKFSFSRLWVKVSKPEAIENAESAFIEIEL